MEKTEAQTIADLATKANAIEPKLITTKEGRELLILPNGVHEKDVTDEHGLKVKPPSYVQQVVTLQKRDSLIDYVNRYKTSRTVLLANIEKNSIAAHVNYHAKSEADKDGAATTNAHKAVMTLPFSLEWETWTKIDGDLMKQLEFARFIEENAPDIKAPSGADLLEVVKDLQSNRRVNFKQAVRTASNNENFEYTVENNVAKPSGSIDIPTQFELQLPVYFGEPLNPLMANLRWEIGDGGGLALGVKLSRAENVRQAVFQEIALYIADKTECPLVYGTLGA